MHSNLSVNTYTYSFSSCIVSLFSFPHLPLLHPSLYSPLPWTKGKSCVSLLVVAIICFTEHSVHCAQFMAISIKQGKKCVGVGGGGGIAANDSWLRRKERVGWGDWDWSDGEHKLSFTSVLPASFGSRSQCQPVRWLYVDFLPLPAPPPSQDSTFSTSPSAPSLLLQLILCSYPSALQTPQH